MFGSLFVFLPLLANGLSCLYYRIRADEFLTAENTITRNCSSQVTQCLKIIHKLESAEASHIDSTIEGRCAYSPSECKENECFSEDPKERGGFVVREYKCCSKEDLSNGGTRVIVKVILFLIQIQQFLLE